MRGDSAYLLAGFGLLTCRLGRAVETVVLGRPEYAFATASLYADVLAPRCACVYMNHTMPSCRLALQISSSMPPRFALASSLTARLPIGPSLRCFLRFKP